MLFARVLIFNFVKFIYSRSLFLYILLLINHQWMKLFYTAMYVF